jgi:Restriction endonuclease
MTAIDGERIAALFAAGDRADTSTARGRALEDVIVYLFELIPGVTCHARNELNASGDEEIDVAFWNDQHQDGLRQFDKLILVECKNWSTAVDSKELLTFQQKLEDRGRPQGILVAANGITGDPNKPTAAHSALGRALMRKLEILVLTRYEIEQLTDTAQLIRLLKRKCAQLAVSGTVYLDGKPPGDPPTRTAGA